MAIFPVDNKLFQLRSFSFGGGVQSTALMLLIKHEPDRMKELMGHLPEVAIFADTGAEPAATHNHIALLEANGLPVRLEVVKREDINLEGSIFDGESRTYAPFYVRTPNEPRPGMLMRKCTQEFKVVPIQRRLRELAGYSKGQRIPYHAVAVWMGISTDEVDRMRVNRDQWIQNLYPLVELGWDRNRCLDYCHEHGFEPPKSRCYFCPYIRDWSRMRREEPEEFAKALRVDEAIRRHPAYRGEAFLHRLGLPLNEAVDELERREVVKGEWLYDDFREECQGHCGV